ncbi:MAG: ABATE domain-containing protein [Gemmatimonadaceae bacterium]
MPPAPAPLSVSPEKPLKFVGGDPSIDFVNTVDWTSRGPDHDRIPDYERLTRWAEEAGVISAAVGEQLRRGAASRPREAASAYAGAVWLRWVLQRLFSAVAAGEPPGAALEEFNDLLADALRRLRVDRARSGRRRIGWAWRGMGDDLASPLWPVVRAAADLLTSDEAARIRACDAPECGWLYVDRSRNGLRRWCQMETCGTRAKNERRYRRARRR